MWNHHSRARERPHDPARDPALIHTICALSLTLTNVPGASNTAPRAETSAPVAQPNVLLIVLDDVGVDLVGSYAADYPSLPLTPCTPTIDALAAGGTRFTNAYCNPVCSPTRAQILTGKPALRTGVGAITFRGANVPGNHGLQPSEDTLAKLLAGYDKAALGKWHVTDPDQDGTTFLHPFLMGFERFAGNLYGLDPAYDSWTKTITPPGAQFPGTQDYATSDTTADALAELATMQEPWFLQVAYNCAHSPFHCPEELGYEVGELGQDPCPELWGADCVNALGSPPCTTLGPDACRARGMMHAVDNEIGKLLAAIDLDQTVVFVVGDNGTPPEPTVPPFVRNRAKGTVYQGGIHVPLIAHVPGGQAGERHELVSVTDLYATIGDLTNNVPPTDAARDSVSFVRLLFPGAAQNFTSRETVYSEFFSPNFIPVAGGPPPGYEADFHMRAVRNDSFKLVAISGKHPWNAQCVDTLELYHLAYAPPQDPAFGPDPFEQNDLMPSMASWTPDVQQAFAQLSLELATSYPLLPLAPCP